MRKVALFLCAIFFVVSVQAQSEFDLVNIGRAKDVSKMNFGEDYVSQNHVVFIVNKHIMLIYDTPTQYNYVYYEVERDHSGEEIIILNSTESVLKKRKKSKQKELKHLFSEKCTVCKADHVFFPKNLGSYNMYQTYNYFILYRNGSKVCEYNVPYAFIDDYKGYDIPLDLSYLGFLFFKITNTYEK